MKQMYENLFMKNKEEMNNAIAQNEDFPAFIPEEK